MKNVTVYIGTINKCLDFKEYEKNGNETYIPEARTRTIEMGTTRPNIKEINNQAILIKPEYNLYYQFKLTNTFKDNLRIIFENPHYALSNKPNSDGSIFVDETTLIPYYNEQPKSLSLRKLKKDILMDPRIKTGIEH